MSIDAINAATIVAGTHRGAPPRRLVGKAAYKPPTASIARTGGHSGSANSRLSWMLTAPAVALFIYINLSAQDATKKHKRHKRFPYRTFVGSAQPPSVTENTTRLLDNE